MNFQKWISKAVNVLTESQNPRRDAEILLEFVTNRPRAFLLAFNETLLTKKQEVRLNALLSRRKMGEPIAYIKGEKEFWSLPLYVSPVTLIPRPDTECLVEKALMYLSKKPSYILDLGTGTGAIALALASERPDCHIVAVDIVKDALTLTYRNIRRLSLYNVYTIQSYWFDSLFNQTFDMIVSNPPYIDIEDPSLLHRDMQFEPLTALVSEEKGMKDINYIIMHAQKYLASGGWLLIEHGWNQGRFVRSQFIQEDYHDVKTYCDYGGNDRVTLGKKM